MLKDQFQYISIREVMEQLDVSRSTVDRWRKTKQMPSVKIGKEIYFDKNELQRWYRGLSRMRRVPEDAPPVLAITVGYTPVSTHMWSPIVIKELGLFEQELGRIRPSDRIDVRWHRAKDGMELVKGMLAGQIQIATFGDYALSVCRLLSQIMPDFHPVLLAAGGKSPRGGGFAFVVPNGTVLNDLSELATLPIATTFRTNAEYRLRKLLESHRLPELNIIHRSIDDSIESLRQGRLNATMMWEPYLSLVRHEGIGIAVFQRELASGLLAGVAADERWVLAHEDVTVAYMKAHLLAGRLFREEPYRAAPAIAKETEWPVEAVIRSISNVRWDAALYRNDLKLLNHVDPAFYLGYNASPSDIRVPYSVKYLRIAAQELKLPVPPPAPLEGEWHGAICY
ncbi:helix-turn-helix domain-containing protein [Paenibacillus sp. GYB003]|uniref:helix-turn-helix domain-containing protein n=1 Tax=Paenibacillus sp. GYB003 TaxID=2994392 RepID=UPI002F969840